MEKIPTLKNNKELLEPMIVKESSGLVLVPNEDKRQAWKAEAKDEFKVLGVDLAIPGSDSTMVMAVVGDKIISSGTLDEMIGIVDPFS